MGRVHLMNAFKDCSEMDKFCRRLDIFSFSRLASLDMKRKERALIFMAHFSHPHIYSVGTFVVCHVSLVVFLVCLRQL